MIVDEADAYRLHQFKEDKRLLKKANKERDVAGRVSRCCAVKPGADPAICVRGSISLPFPLPSPLLSLSPPFLFPYPPFLSPPFPSPFLPPLPSHPIPFPSLPSPPLRSRPPILRLGGLGERLSLKLPQRVRTEPGRQTVFGEL